MHRIRLLSYRSRGTLMSYSDHSAQRCFKSNAPNERCSTDHMIKWRINGNVILYEDHVRINRFSNTNDNKNSASTLFSYPGFSSSVFVYTGFQNSSTILTILCNSSCSGHVILAQILLDDLCFRFAKLKRFVGLVRKKKHLHFRCANVRGLCGSIHRNLLFYSSASDIRFAFSRSVWKGL